ncbi:MAG: AhpC/TSA family protein [Candidatus Sumerlaeia bacterium]|nr:AhpC/TSA family protein [Candidatus Sumerlaeia bacterium]
MDTETRQDMQTELPSDLLGSFRNQHGTPLISLTKAQPVMLVLLRHSGCLFCRETLARVAEKREAIEAKGVRIVLVHMGTEKQGSAFFGQYGLEDLDRISDPARKLYKALDLGMATPGQLFNLDVWRRGFRILLDEGHFIGIPHGNTFQMPGTFLVKGNRVIAAHRHKTAADNPGLEEVSCAV